MTDQRAVEPDGRPVAGGPRGLPPRSMLFVPADRLEELLPKARASGADAIIVDLEDAVAPSAKASARAQFVGMGGALPRSSLVVRINADPPEALADDIVAASQVRPSAVLLPKSTHVAEVEEVVRALGRTAESDQADIGVIALIECSRGVLASREIATVGGVIGLALGTEDLTLDLHATRSRNGRETLVAQGIVLLSARSEAWASLMWRLKRSRR